MSLFDFLPAYATQTEFYGCNFLNIASEIPKENKKVRAIVQKQKNGIRALFSEILQPLGKEELADELYLLFDAGLMTCKVYNDTWPAKTARKIVEKLL